MFTTVCAWFQSMCVYVYVYVSVYVYVYVYMHIYVCICICICVSVCARACVCNTHIYTYMKIYIHEVIVTDVSVGLEERKNSFSVLYVYICRRRIHACHMRPTSAWDWRRARTASVCFWAHAQCSDVLPLRSLASTSSGRRRSSSWRASGCPCCAATCRGV